MKKIFSLSFLATILAFAAKATIIGSSSICLGNPGYVTDSLNPGGSWSSSNVGVATVDASGNVFGVSVGSCTLTYIYGSPAVTETWPLTVNPAAPAALTGPSSVCAGSMITLASTTTGGTWASNNVAVATVDASGNVYGVVNGNALISYYAGGSPCAASKWVNVTTGSTGSIGGPSTVCAGGGTITLTDSGSVSGGSGTWASSNNAIATVDAAGVVTGVGVGTVTISFTYIGTCGSVTHTKTISVINTSTPATLSGATSLYVGANATIYASPSGGVWSSSNNTIATVSSTGVVYGVAVGTVTISYATVGCGGTAYATRNVSITAFSGISGNVVFSSSTGGFYGSMKVWLITYDAGTGMLEAVDSISTFANGMSKYYQFTTVPTGDYRVKAAVYDSLGTTTGYIPTYHTSSFYWYSATVISHTAGTGDINKDITMMIGTPTSGPGFVGGNVSAGANKGTTVGDPIEGLQMNIMNSSNVLIQSVRTDVNGNYSFSNLPLGTYTVFPDSLNYLTTAYDNITLTSSASAMSAASFRQNTLSGTITPIPTSVNAVSNISSIVAFPNPASNKLTLQWTAANADNGTLTISDITGREVYSSAISFAAGAGVKTVDLSSMTNGLYIVSVKTASSSYTTKVQVQH